MTLHRTLWPIVLAVVLVSCGAEAVAGPPAPLAPVPTPQQVEWQRGEISIFLHFGVNTFTDREWGEGKEDPKIFNPTDLDARQWVRAAKAAGAKILVLTAKHHDGFCLWPSKYTEHCVKNSPWRNGKGDVVRELADACRARAPGDVRGGVREAGAPRMARISRIEKGRNPRHCPTALGRDMRVFARLSLSVLSV